MNDIGEQQIGVNGLDGSIVTDPIRARCQMDIFDGSQQDIGSIANEVLSLHFRVFPKTVERFLVTPEDSPSDVERKQRVFEFERKGRLKDVQRLITDPRSCLVLCRDKEKGKYVGYTLAVPIGLSDVKRDSESDETAYIFNTSFLPDYQGHKLVGDIMPVLEEELRNKGYKFVERDVRIEHDYHLSIERNYGSRIVGK